jgi:hypothetical protein
MFFFDRVRETSVTTGTGTFSLDGAVRSYDGFVEAGLGSKVVTYAIGHRTADEWEVGIGTITDATPDTLSRTKILGSSNADAAVDFSAGTKDVFLTHSAINVDGSSRLRLPCRAVSVSTIPIATALATGQTLDGLTLAAGDRVLCIGQTTASENGIYVVGATPARSGDFFTGGQAAGSIVFVTAGTVGAGTAWRCSAVAASDVIGTNNLSWTPFLSGPSSSTDNAIARWNGTLGAKIQNSGVLIDDADKVQGKASFSSMNAAADGATITFDLDLDNVHTVTLGGNRTLAISNADVGQRFMIKLIQDATGSRTVTWFSNISWPGGVVPTLTTTALKGDWFGFIVTGVDGYGAPEFDGFTLGQNF